MLIILTLAFIQGHTDLTPHKNNKYSIISDSVQAMPIKLAMEIVRQKVYIVFSQSDDIDLHSRSQLPLKRDKLVTCTLIVVISRIIFKLWHSKPGMMLDLCMAYIYTHAHSDDLDLDARSQWVSTRKK